MSGAIPLLPQYVFIVWTGTTLYVLPFYDYHIDYSLCSLNHVRVTFFMDVLSRGLFLSTTTTAPMRSEYYNSARPTQSILLSTSLYT